MVNFVMLDAIINNMFIQKEKLRELVKSGHNVVLVGFDAYPPPYEIAIVGDSDVYIVYDAYYVDLAGDLFWGYCTDYVKMYKYNIHSFADLHSSHRRFDVPLKSYYAVKCGKYVYVHTKKTGGFTSPRLPPPGIMFRTCSEAYKKYVENDYIIRFKWPNEFTELGDDVYVVYTDTHIYTFTYQYLLSINRKLLDDDMLYTYTDTIINILHKATADDIADVIRRKDVNIVVEMARYTLQKLATVEDKTKAKDAITALNTILRIDDITKLLAL
ncbi:MAG: hypothetical protein QW196_03725 [Sulfolobales archaeon]